jgi:hypothetical protein
MEHFGREVELRKRDAGRPGIDFLIIHLLGIYPRGANQLQLNKMSGSRGAAFRR